MAQPSKERAFDYVVVVMFENRSFDHLLGGLYEPGEVPSFEGVLGKELLALDKEIGQSVPAISPDAPMRELFSHMFLNLQVST